MLITNRVETIPEAQREALRDPHVMRLFMDSEYYEDIRDDPTLRRILAEIGEYALDNGLLVYHCTKELSPGRYASQGLRVLNQQLHVDEFISLARDQGLLSEQQIWMVEPTLRTWREGTGHVRREGTLHFLHGRDEVVGWGTQKFFTYYGGEALFWPFGPRTPGEPHWFLKVLTQIGRPVVVEAKVDPALLLSGSDSFGADVAVSYFARSVNPNFNLWHPYCLTKDSIPPENVVSTVNLLKFLEDCESRDWQPPHTDDSRAAPRS